MIYNHGSYPIASNMFEHIKAFRENSRFPVWEVNTHFGFPEVLRELEFKVIVLHYSLFAYLPFVEEKFRAYIAECESSYKVAFFQDEYWFWPERSEVLNRFKVDCVYTCIEPEYYEATYWKYTRVPRLVTYLPGYVSEEMVEVASRVSKPDAERRVDIGYRGRLSPDFIWLGKGACEKYEIGVHFLEKASGSGWCWILRRRRASAFTGMTGLRFWGTVGLCWEWRRGPRSLTLTTRFFLGTDVFERSILS